MDILLIILLGVATVLAAEPATEKKIRKNKKLFYKVLWDKIWRKVDA